jgi:hypothetical protein
MVMEAGTMWSSMETLPPVFESAAVIEMSPGKTPCTIPAEDTVAMVPSEEDQEMPEESRGVPTRSVTDAVSCILPLTRTLGDGDWSDITPFWAKAVAVARTAQARNAMNLEGQALGCPE